MGRDVIRGGDNSLGQLQPGPWMRPSISQNRAATIRRRSVPPCPREIRVPTTPEIRAYPSARRCYANISCRWMAQVDDGKRVSWASPDAHLWHPWQFVGGVIFHRSFNVWPISDWVSCCFFEKYSRVSVGSPPFATTSAGSTSSGFQSRLKI